MKVLWVTNIMIPKIAMHLSIPINIYGGWLTGLSNDLLNEDVIDLSICFPFKNDQYLEGVVDNLNYYSFNNQETRNNQEKRLEEIINKSNPDIIHIFGTEYIHTLYMVKVCEKIGMINNVVIHIQGLVSVASIHYYAFLPNKIVKRFTIRDLFKRDNIYLGKKRMARRGEQEIKALQRVKHVMGRTTWDKACTSLINPSLNYHFCNESLRDSFYKSTWNYENCEKYSIFVSQGNYPIKGLHYVIEALQYIVSEFPNTTLYVAGNDISKVESFMDHFKISSYGKYLRSLVAKYKLEENVQFLGMLDEIQILNQYLKSNVFISPSSIENSPNSVGEAMLLGVPCISSHVGGVPDMLMHNKEGFIYQTDAPYMLAYYVSEIFRKPEIAKEFSYNSQKRAILTHDRIINRNRVLEIYNQIIKND